MKITRESLAQYYDKYNGNPTNKAVQNAIAKVGINKSSVDNNMTRRHNFVFSHETEKGDITNQKSSGRCWMFAALNTARVDTMEKLNVKTFEFSQNYTLFWDKLEKSNYFLDSMIETVDEPLNSRLVQHLLKDPVQDGGQWDMFSGILAKYGAVPKSAMPETYHSANTRELNQLLTAKLRDFAAKIRKSHKEGKQKEELIDQKEDYLYFVYALLVKTLGEVPESFTYEYRDKDEQFHRISDITPQEFFQKYVAWDLEERISLINAPTEDKPFGKAYTVKYLGTIKEAQPIRYVNAPVEALKKAAVKSIKDGEPVWFGCDVGKMLDREAGIMDDKAYDYKATLGEPVELTKAQRLDYGESLLTHAMVFVGVDLDDEGNPVKWKVENSWGDKNGDKGVYSMTDKWFDEYNYQVAVKRKYIDDKWLNALQEPVVELEPWDPMGALAMVQ
ncbi:bleomycin hydrolase [Alkalibacterium subtropicum]|uniref:Aminopeptidase n=1 Tax=Alkalibacterium subtropicum TaxID=753702 RepID=A0A1I1K1B6_9LACT|nr:C1 family peptidase [Alkalibacterium subtropicum]SFC54747.1 bleomycin hydrolase [Alkalibacterium subtropicum]